MLIKVLLENTKTNKNLKAKHGLSFYLEVAGLKLLFDMGPNHLFWENATKMQIDLTKVDLGIISHGHSDHGGGSPTFLQKNLQAPIIVQENFFEQHYINVLGLKIPVGIKKVQFPQERLIFNTDTYAISDSLLLFSHVSNETYMPFENTSLFKKSKGHIQIDDFTHEQSLIIKNGEQYILLSGCGHTGILNIQYTAEQLVSAKMDIVISGFHLYNPITRQHVDKQTIIELAAHMKKQPTQYYTCHCTGKYAFQILQDLLGEQIQYLGTGAELVL